jgi:hyperosmotically inducible protein
VIIQQPAPVQQAPVIVNPPAGGSSTSSMDKDAAIQTEIDKRIMDDSTFSSLGITATVSNGKVTLVGTVKNNDQKAQVERMVRNIKGVSNVDNQISVIP